MVSRGSTAGGSIVLMVLLRMNVLWDFNVYVDHMISARRPDIIVMDKAVSNVILIDVSILADKNAVADTGAAMVSAETPSENMCTPHPILTSGRGDILF